MFIKTKAASVAKNKLKLKTPKLVARLPFDKKAARRAMPMAYYTAQSRNLKDTGFICQF